MNHGSGAPVPQSAPAKSVVNLENLSMRVEKRDGTSVSFDRIKVEESIRRCSKGFENEIVEQDVIEELIKNSFDGISTKDLEKALILAAVALIERDPAYNKLAARLTLQKIYKEISGKNFTDDTLITVYKESFINGIKEGIAKERFDAELADYPLEELAEELCIERDDLFGYMGIQTLYERYFVKHKKKRLELPQSFWMRVAMGLALGEKKELRKQKTLEFYHTLSTLRYVSSTPTLFHAGLVRSQLSSCYLTYIDDDLNHIFKCLGDNANLSKYSGGIGSDWTPLRGTGSPIETIGVDSQGVIPFLKIANDVVAAINRSGSRRGAAAVYLESWHLDFEDFIDLRRNTGDERRRTHDMNTAAWIPDLFMKRVLEDKEWTFFSPHETPDLHELYGKKFEDAYHAYEEKTKTGEIKFFKRVKAKDLWRKMLSRLFETGHPWITFKDACNVRSPQDHVGVVHSSNLCTEITLNTSREETAVCNLGSVNLSKHIVDGKLDKQGLEKTIKTSIQQLKRKIVTCVIVQLV